MKTNPSTHHKNQEVRHEQSVAVSNVEFKINALPMVAGQFYHEPSPWSQGYI